MADEIKIDKEVFENRASHFISTWKADKRSGDALFGGVGSIVILMGKTEESNSFQKNNAMHVSIPQLRSTTAVARGHWEGLLRLMDIHRSVLVNRLRIPGDTFINHNRSSLHSHDGKEMYGTRQVQ